MGHPDCVGHPPAVLPRLAPKPPGANLGHQAQGQPTFWDTTLQPEHIWQRRFYGFVVWSQPKIEEKLRYMHSNPVHRGLVERPEQWPWSSARDYIVGEAGPVLLNERKEVQLKWKDPDPGSDTGRKAG